MSSEQAKESGSQAIHVDAVVVGAGFAGLYSLHRLREMGLQVQVFEAGADVGGTWYFNRYPGARCDVESVEYSYSFDEKLQQEWEWTERYATQPEILSYINHVADRFKLREDIQFNTRVISAKYDAAKNLWTVRTDREDVITATYCIMAAGNLSAARLPPIDGIESFAGTFHHTGQWPHDGVDFTGKRVGVIGTGSSGIQVIPLVAQEAAHLTVFQRTANYSIPARNRPLVPEEVKEVKANYGALRKKARDSGSGLINSTVPTHAALQVSEAEREQAYKRSWAAGRPGIARTFTDLLSDKDANKTAAAFADARICEKVSDPATADKLVPKDLYIGAKRVCLDTNYYETFNRDNVTLVDIRRHPIKSVNASGIVTSEGEHHLDAIVLATGYDAVTGALLAIDVRGVGGKTLKEKWADGPRAYLGLMTAGFPNMFIVTGPGSPSILTNMVLAIEQHVEFIADCIGYLRKNGKSKIDANVEAEDNWVSHVGGLANNTLFPLVNSWYVGANIPGKPRTFMAYLGGVNNYIKKCDEVAASNYDGFAIS
jgi:cyclohexanone monooxygenase